MNSTSASHLYQPAQPSAYQDDFYLLDVVGGKNISCMHPTKPIVAYTAGCMIIIYDLISDAKIQLVNHQHEVKALSFSPLGAGGSQTGGDCLISIDLNRNVADNTATMCLWNWARGACLQELILPQKTLTYQDNSSFILKFDRTGTLFTVLQSTLTAYRISVWAFSRHQSIDLIAHSDLDHQNGCSAMQIIKTRQQGPANQAALVYLNQSMQILTLEKNCIKIWEFQNGAFDLQKRIHIKQPVCQCIVAELTGFLLILGENGKVLILDQQGEFVSTVFKQGVFFTTVGVANDKLLLGTERGQIHVYHLASLSFVSEIPYQFSLLPRDQLNKAGQESVCIGPPTMHIELTQNLRFIKIQYADSSFVVIDRTQQDLKEAIIGHHSGHFEAVTDIQWMGVHPSRDGDFQQDQYSLLSQSNECFISVSSDLSVFIWRHFGDRWQHSYIDVAKCFDESLSYQRKGCDRSTKELQLTSVCIYPRRRQNILIGDNKGTVRIFQLGKQSATLLATFTLQRAEKERISSVFISDNEQVAVITFDSGQISLYDVKSSFTWIGDVESSSALSAMHQQKSIVLEKQQPKVSDTYAQMQYQQQGTSLKVFSVTAPNCIRVQLVDVKDGRMTKSQLVQYFIAEGKISGFDLHPSKDYILVTSNRGRLYVYRIETGELRGTINVPQHAQGCLVDPSGLYVVVQVPPFTPTTGDFLGANERNLKRTAILMYEVGTGLAAAEILSIFDISQMRFSSDARYLSLGSLHGTVSVWALGEHLHQNVQQVLEQCRVSNDFWYNYPIFLPDHQSNPVPPRAAIKLEPAMTQPVQMQSNPNPYLQYLPAAQLMPKRELPLMQKEVIVEVDRHYQTPVKPIQSTQVHQAHKDQKVLVNEQFNSTNKYAVNQNSPNKAQYLYQLNDDHKHTERQQEQPYQQYFYAKPEPVHQKASTAEAWSAMKPMEAHKIAADRNVEVEYLHSQYPVQPAQPKPWSPKKPVEVEHMHTQYPVPQPKAPFENFQAPQPYIEYVPGQQQPLVQKIVQVTELKQPPVQWVPPPAFQQTVNYMDRSLNDRDLELSRQMDASCKLISGIGASTLYKPRNDFVQALDKKPQVAIEPDDIDQDDEEIICSFGRPVQEKEHSDNEQGIDESLGEEVDEAYRAIEEFEQRRMMQQSQYLSKVHPQQFPIKHPKPVRI